MEIKVLNCKKRVNLIILKLGKGKCLNFVKIVDSAEINYTINSRDII